jgi:hypothetical protein
LAGGYPFRFSLPALSRGQGRGRPHLRVNHFLKPKK